MSIIYAIPGLGTTGELFQNIRIPGHELKVLSWPLPQKGFTLQQYAAEFLKQVNGSSPVNLIGVSFGGMLCAELASTLKTNKVVLISSCKNSSEFPALLKLLKVFPVYKAIPESLFRKLAMHSRKVLGFEKKLEPVFFKMVNSMPANYFSCCINYIVQWGLKRQDTHVVRIHGNADRLLTPTRIENGYIIKGGSHAMVLNKAEEINKILNTVFNEH